MRRSTALTAAALLLLAAAAAYMSIAAYVERSEEVETRRMFRDWMAKYKKKYSSIGEEEHRYAVYKENLRRIAAVNAAGRNTAVDATGLLNVFGDLTNQELSSIYPGTPSDWSWSNKGTGGRGQAVSSQVRPQN